MSSSRSHRAFAVLLFAVLTGAPCSSLAASISSIAVLPALPTSSDPITLRVELSYPTSGYSVGSFDTIFLDSTAVRLDVFVDSPAPDDIILPVLESETVDAPLGSLPEADYTYTVRLFEIPGGTSVPLLSEVASGGFSVVPEPTTIVLVGGGLLLLPGLSRRRASRRS